MLRRRFFLPSIAAAALLLAATTGGALSGGFGATAVAATNGTLAATAGCGKAPTLASGTRTIQSSGQSRTYNLRIPDGYDRNRPYRLIFGFHWLNGSANNVASAGYYGLQPLSNNSTIFVAPQGLDTGWANTDGRDLTLFDDISRQIENDLCVDTTQRFALGWSYGGAMSYAVACARPTVFRAVTVCPAPTSADATGHPAGRLLRHPRHPRQRAEHLPGSATARHVRAEQRLHRAEPAASRAGAASPTSPPPTRVAGPATRCSGRRSTVTTPPARWTGRAAPTTRGPGPRGRSGGSSASSSRPRRRRPHRRPIRRPPIRRRPPRRRPGSPAPALPPTGRSTPGPAASRPR